MQYAPYRSKVNPDSLRELAIKELTALCPNFKSLIEHSRVITPRDLESPFQLTGPGNLYGGEINPRASFTCARSRFFPQYHTPILAALIFVAQLHIRAV